MYKKSILSVAIASSLMLTGCFENNKANDENENSITNPPSAEQQAEAAAKLQRSYPVFSPATADFPKPNDLLIQRDSTTTAAIEQSDGSYLIPGSDDEDATPPFIALENLSGASLTAPIDIEIGNLVPGAGNVDETTLDARSFVIAGASVIPNPNQNVFLIELEYASDAPLTGLSIREKPTVTNGILALRAQAGDPTAQAALLSQATSPLVDAKVITRTKSNGAETTYIRINPLKPLNPNKRYIVVLTDEVKDLSGSSLIQSPGAAGYEALTDSSVGLASPALAPVRTIINDLWETVAVGYFSNLTNAARAAEDALSADNIVFSISFTTSNDTKVIDYMAEPNTWISDTIKSLVKTGAAKAALAAGAADYSAIKSVVDSAYNSWSAAAFNSLLAGCDTAYPDNTEADATTRATAASSRFSCAGSALEGYLTSTVGLSFPKPTADTDITFTGQRDLRAVSAVITDAIATPGTVNISEGTLTIPYYLEAPNARGTVDTSIANLVNGWWKADAALATGLNTAFNLDALDSPLPQAVPASGSNKVQSNIVNAFFPFPKANTTLEIPILAIYPTGPKPEDGFKTIIYQHGITTDRSAALTLGSKIVADSGGTIAVIAIDQPLHGIDASSEGDKAILSEKLLAGAGEISFDGVFDGTDSDASDQEKIDHLVAGTFFSSGAYTVVGASTAFVIQSTVTNSASTIPGLARNADNERHFDFAGVNLRPVPMDFTNGTVGTSSNEAIDQPNTGSGALSINIGNFLTSRDNFRQQIVDLLTLRLSIPYMDLDGDDTPDLDTNDVHFIGHSLGTINGIPFVEIANQTATSADNIKTANFLTPGGNVARLAENSEAFAPSILLGLNSVAGLNRGDADLEAFLNVFQIALDAFDPINFVGNLSSTTSTTKALFTEVVGDSTIPNSANPALDIVQPEKLIQLIVNDDYSVTKNVFSNPVVGVSFGLGTDAPLAGTSPLEKASGATAIDSTTELGINFIRFAESSNATHGSPVTGSPALVFGQIAEYSKSLVLDEEVSIIIPSLIQDAD